jgi:hypothetical protein
MIGQKFWNSNFVYVKLIYDCAMNYLAVMFINGTAPDFVSDVNNEIR